MILYHVSQLEYKVGEIYSTCHFDGEITSFYSHLSPLERQVEDILKDKCPYNGIDRKKIMYFFSDPDFCEYFASKQYRDPDSWKIYKVEVLNEYGGFPICLVNAILRNLDNDALCHEIANEYWTPTSDWLVLEYLGEEMKILDVIQEVNCLRVSMWYNIDYELSQKKYQK